MTTQTAQIAENMTETQTDLRTMANAIRALSMDAVQKANSGHPGMPMGMADVATVLYSKFMKFNPEKPDWPDRDRFILSGGHGSMLLYSLLYLTGYKDMTIDQIKNFRQLGSITPGHPERHITKGVETTTGPLGQGIGNAVGFALAERILNKRFGDDLVDHYTYVMCGDGDLMEGISHEACSLAGHLNLSRLIMLYDDNGICIDGPTSMSFSDNTAERFKAYGWHVQEIDGHDHSAIEKAIATAQTADKPSLICCKTHIGFGAPTKQDSAAAHGAPLGDEEIAGARKNIGWPHAPFEVPDDILQSWRDTGRAHHATCADWEKRLAASAQKDAFEFAMEGTIDERIAPLVQELKESFANDKPSKATRQTSGMVLDKLVPEVQEMIGGSADLTGSNNTLVKDTGTVAAPDYEGQYIYYGVREHGMAAAMNGMALHGGIIPYSGTFLCFTDYCRPSIRLSALMAQRVIYVMTHDSIGLGEDGPTHQPVEHLAAMRAIPNLFTYRPCDGVETAECWQLALGRKDAPAIMALTRQGLPTLRGAETENLCAKGAYILSDCEENDPQVTLFASGSEVSIAMEAKDKLAAEGIKAVRVVSVPCMELYAQQDSTYQESLTCNSSIKVAVEAGIRQGWERYIGPHGLFVGMDSFGESAPAGELYKHFKITADHIVEKVKNRLK